VLLLSHPDQSRKEIVSDREVATVMRGYLQDPVDAKEVQMSLQMVRLGFRSANKPHQALALTCLVTLTLACGEDRALSTAVQGRSETAIGIDARGVSDGRLVRPEESAFARLSEQSPSSAGFYINSQGRLVIVVRDEGEDASARSTAASFLATGLISDSRARRSGILIKRGKYTFHQLSRWRDIVFDAILGSVPGVVSLDLDEEANAVTIGLDPVFAADLRTTLPRRLTTMGVDTGAVSFRVHPPLRATVRSGLLNNGLLARRSLPSTLWSDADDMIGGLQIEVYVQDRPRGPANLGICTLGIVADYGSTRGFITAAHCSKYQWLLDQFPVYQSLLPHQVGSEFADPEGWSCGFLGGNTCRNSDASFYSLDPTITSERGLIARTGSSSGPGGVLGDTVIDVSRPFFIVTDVDQENTTQGQVVQKMGRFSGWTWGTVTHTCEDHAHGDWPIYSVTICTYEANYTDHAGDSGGPVFMFPGGSQSASGDIVTLVGIHFGDLGEVGTGQSVFSKWGRIVTDFAPTPLLATRPVTLTQPSLSGSLSQGSPLLSWSTVSGASKYEVYRVAWDGAAYTTVLVTSTSASTFLDLSKPAAAYYGTTQPTGPNASFQYFVYAINQSSVSAKSSVIWYVAPSPSFQVTITGPAAVGPNNHNCSSWTTSIQGGQAPFQYTWSGLFSSSEPTVSGTVPTNGGDLSVDVIDSNGLEASSTFHITYDSNNQDYCQ
jgi:hypothetical protein